jgi:hypothetical protein
VREYWLVNPYPSLVEVLLLDGSSYRIARAYAKTDTLTSPTFADLSIDLGTVFDFPIGAEERIDEVREGTPPLAPRTTAAPTP